MLNLFAFAFSLSTVFGSSFPLFFFQIYFLLFNLCQGNSEKDGGDDSCDSLTGG